jgi:acyl-CoA dehydrogenase
MDFAPSPRAQELSELVRTFIETEIEPVEAAYHHEVAELRAGGGDPWQPLPLIKELQGKARAQGLWNLFLPAGHEGPYAEKYGTHGGRGLTNLEYAPIAELTGRSFLAPLVLNCNAPDTGNMEVLLKYGNQAQKDQWLDPLLDGRIRSAFAMTEPGVASSDATNMALTAVVDGDEIVVNGRKWFITGLGHPDCKVLIVMGLTDPEADRHHRHSMVLVPRDTPGVKVERLLPTMGIYDEPIGHGEVTFTDVRVPIDNFVSGPGEAFAIAQGRLGPGRVHHCMRLIGLAEKALELACRRGTERVAFGKPLANLGGNRERIAEHRIAIDSTRLLVLNAAWKLDNLGPLGALSEVSQIKVAAPRMAQAVIDFAMQIHGGGGMSNDFPLAAAWTTARALRLADGPDEVHLGMVARLELGKYPPATKSSEGRASDRAGKSGVAR